LANLGDSKAIISRSLGLRINVLTKQHKPNQIEERTRIIKYGGNITENNNTSNSNRDFYRYTTIPGKLGVSRSLGDIETKIPKFGGKPGVVIAIPDIVSFKLDEDMDFIIIASKYT
jgi:serine/threonine protein phosphatase PrpC